MNEVKIPHGDEKIQVELTVKEALALSGIRFNQKPQIMLDARKKLQHTLADKTLKKNLH